MTSTKSANSHDRITVLRDGGWRGSLVTASAKKSEIVELIVGRAVDLATMRAAGARLRITER